MTRLGWHDLPAAVRDRIGEVLGSPVVGAVSQAGGYSPGSADRVVTTDGRRAFVKAASPAVNSDTPTIHRREGAITARLPAAVPAPALIGVVDDGEWIALVLEDVEARHPSTPWRARELAAVFDALQQVAAVDLPADVPVVDLADAVARDTLARWRALDPDAIPALPGGLDAWVRTRHHELTDAAAQAVADVRGDRLVHFDTRADNILLRPDGTVVLVDWPWAARGAGWFDALTLLINVLYYDPSANVEALITCDVFDGMPRDAATNVLAALGGMFLEASLRPDPPRMPTLRTFQRDQAIVTLDWVRRRWEG